MASIEELAEIRNADVEQGVRRHARQKIAAAARLGERELCDAVLDKSELRHDADVLLLIRTPRELLLQRLRREVVAGGELFAWMQDCLEAGVGHLHRTLQDADTRSFQARVDGEDRASDGDAAVRRVHVEVARGAMRRLDDDGAAIQGDGHVSAARAHAEGAALVDLHQRAICKAHSGARTGSGTQLLTFVQCGTRRDGAIDVVGDQ